MKLEEIKSIAQQHRIKAGKMKKSELIRAIQSAEGGWESGVLRSGGLLLARNLFIK